MLRARRSNTCCRMAFGSGSCPCEGCWVERCTMDINVDVVLKRFESPDEVREMPFGRFEIVRLGGMTVGRATYQPGWKWSTHVGPTVGASRCTVEHLGLVVSGVATAAFANGRGVDLRPGDLFYFPQGPAETGVATAPLAEGRVVELRPGDLFYIPPEPHDSWVVGTEPYVSLHFLG